MSPIPLSTVIGTLSATMASAIQPPPSMAPTPTMTSTPTPSPLTEPDSDKGFVLPTPHWFNLTLLICSLVGLLSGTMYWTGYTIPYIWTQHILPFIRREKIKARNALLGLMERQMWEAAALTVEESKKTTAGVQQVATAIEKLPDALAPVLERA
ncbi:hypothetical protein B0T20DRAFT_477457 [Sordaria brevicollis]|uniref:Uncharacterized protein n=1 Tax=Sordaria brevicollis TaxID=83679 RepID=A0AAE0PGL6_SORBR|nr:hypothetical protein B0T20DRAFT_477457 [Sordaria brevicollis]